ncbi:MAG: NAD-dependent epimerase/dehydratase family protein [Sphingomonadaceae bacterium]
MIIGNGLLAQAFKPAFAAEHEVLVYASGVSNSQETRPEEFARERALLEQALDTERFMLYFSTCSVNDPEQAHMPYVQHKQAMEALILERARQKAIFRLPQVVGPTPNPYTLTNYLHHQISHGLRFKVWLHASRNLIDVADVAAVVCHLVRTHQADGVITNVASPAPTGILQLVHIFEEVLDKPAVYDTVDAGATYAIEADLALHTARAAGIDFGPDYVPKLIRKYYGR